MLKAIVRVWKEGYLDTIKDVVIFTSTERYAALTGKLRDQHPGYVTKKIMSWEPCSAMELAKANGEKEGPRLVRRKGKAIAPRPGAPGEQDRREYLTTVIAYSRVRPNTKAASGYDQGVLFELEDGSEIWINDCVSAWSASALNPGDQAVIVNVASTASPVWVYEGRAETEFAA